MLQVYMKYATNVQVCYHVYYKSTTSRGNRAVASKTKRAPGQHAMPPPTGDTKLQTCQKVE